MQNVAVDFLQDSQRLREFPLQNKYSYAAFGNHSFWIEIRWNVCQHPLGHAHVPFPLDRELRLQSPQTERGWRHFNPAIIDFLGGLIISDRLVVDSKILQDPANLRIDGSGLLEICGRFRPLTFTPLDRAEREKYVRIVRQSVLRDLEFAQRAIVIQIAVIITVTQRQVRLG